MSQEEEENVGSIQERQDICRSVAESFASSGPRVRFTFSDIDLDRVSFYERLDAEVKSIYESPRARKGRSVFSIRDSSFRGLVAEAWYVQNQPFPGAVSWTDRRWHDVAVMESKYPSFSGTHIEVKTVSEWSKKEVFKKIDSIVWAKWNTSSFVSMFLTNWDHERDSWFKTVKQPGGQGTFVEYVESGRSAVWWEYYGTRCIDPAMKLLHKTEKADI